jgi:hypothetical protein
MRHDSHSDPGAHDDGAGVPRSLTATISADTSSTRGRGGGFSLEAPTGYRFLTRSRLYEDDEWRELEAAGPPPHGPQAEHRL